MIKEKNFGKCDSVSSASSRRALEHIVPGGHREVLQWDRVRVKARISFLFAVKLFQTDDFGRVIKKMNFRVRCKHENTG